jgi:hypothetical protein
LPVVENPVVPMFPNIQNRGREASCPNFSRAIKDCILHIFKEVADGGCLQCNVINPPFVPDPMRVSASQRNVMD